MTATQHVALITGASRGLGLEIARAYARTGLKLALTARGEAALKAAALELQEVTDVLAIAGDVADASHAQRLVDAARDRFGGVDVLVNNASELGPSPLPELVNLPLNAFEQVLRVNVLAPLGLIQAVLPSMVSSGSGLIINVTSDAGVEAYPTWGGYGSSKAALEHLSRVLAAELAGSGVRVYVVDPGDMNTEMHRLAEPGVDLSGVPGPAASAPAFVRLLDETAAFGRFHAQNLSSVGV
jgi:NAD(P)-dependent dehydrogenase (short-subunit alcohol dehydrogenase family)